MIYADNAATTPLSSVAFTSMLPYLQTQFGNASSVHHLGVEARRAVEKVRQDIAALLGASAPEILFTSGGSEANTWVLNSLVEHFTGKPVHIITSAIEHPSILHCCAALEKKGIQITRLPVDGSGRIFYDQVANAIQEHTRLVSIMAANNEIGTIQPIAEIGSLLKDKKILFHSDAVQAVGHMPLLVQDLQVDFLTASAHKFQGPKGTGFLYARKGTPLMPLIHGGGQEQTLRGGTENVAAIVGMGVALLESMAKMESEAERLKSMAGKTVAALLDTVGYVTFNGEGASTLPGLINVCIEGVSGEALMHVLDMKGICISTSSACNAGRDSISHVLLALGLSREEAQSSIRISYGSCNKEEDADALVRALRSTVIKMRRKLSATH